MQIKSKILHPIQNCLVFEIDDDAQEIYEQFADQELKLTISKYYKSKTLSQNSYYWVLLSQLSLVLKTTPQELHELNVQRHSIPWTDDDGKHLCISILKDILPPKVEHLYWKWIKDDGKCSAYMRIKGLSECNTQEVSMFLEDLIEECKANGIETMTPEELSQLKI